LRVMQKTKLALMKVNISFYYFIIYVIVLESCHCVMFWYLHTAPRDSSERFLCFSCYYSLSIFAEDKFALLTACAVSRINM
jgi:hypothetical protein